MRSLLKEFLIILGCTLVGISYGLISGMSPKPWIEPELPAGAIRLSDASAMSVIWLDARSESDYAQDHLPDALWVNPDDWESAIPDMMDVWLSQPRPIVVYCSSKACNTSERIAQALREALPNAEVYYLMGGWPQ